MRFTKRLTNGPQFVWNSRSSLSTWQFNYALVNQIVNFQKKLWISRRVSFGSWEFVASDVRVIRCDWLGNITTKWKHFSTKQSLCYDVYFWNVNYLTCRGTPNHQTDGTTSIWLKYVNIKFQQHENEIFSVFALFLEWRVSCKKVLFISDRFKCKILLNHYAWKFYLNCYPRINNHNRNCILFLGRCRMTNSVATFYNPF